MKDSTFWKKQFEQFIKQRLCHRRDYYIYQSQRVDDQIEQLLDSETEALANQPASAVLFLYINDEFNKVDPIGVYPEDLVYEYNSYAWELVALFERSDEITFYWQLPMYLQYFWERMSFSPDDPRINLLEQGIRNVAEKFYEMKAAREKRAGLKAGKS